MCPRTWAAALVFLFLISGLATSARADVAPFKPLDDLRASTPHLIDEGGVRVLGAGALLLVGARDLDEDMQERFRNQNRLGGFDHLGNEVLGTGVPGLLLAGGFWWQGERTQQARTVRAGQASLEAIATTFVATSGIKVLADRERPDGSDRHSFPSGHTSTVFASAGVLHEFYGWEVGAVADALGVLTAFSRVQANKHWFSDTVGGGLLGFSIGRAVARAHREQLGELAHNANGNGESPFTVVPIVDSTFFGAQLTARF